MAHIRLQDVNKTFGAHNALIDFNLDVAEGDSVTAGQVIGRVYKWPDARAPSHLHFEIRRYGTAENPVYFLRNQGVNI